MIDVQGKRDFEARVEAGGRADDARRLTRALKSEPDPQAGRDLAALFLHAAAVSPELLAAIYDGATEGWLGAAPRASIIEAPSSPGPVATEFWPAFWALATGPRTGRDAGAVTQQTAALSGLLSRQFQGRVARMALLYPGVAQAAALGYPQRFTLDALALCPRESLGGEFHVLIVDSGFDLEVLDREALGLSNMPAPLDYLNARILQCHDLWHIVGGYRTTALHEVAISAFQMAQFGHHYSSMFLAMVMTRVALDQPDALGLFLDTILSAWTHGRESPPLIGLDWETIWDRSVETIRADHGLRPYASPYPADLFEQMAPPEAP